MTAYDWPFGLRTSTRLHLLVDEHHVMTVSRWERRRPEREPVDFALHPNVSPRAPDLHGIEWNANHHPGELISGPSKNG